MYIWRKYVYMEEMCIYGGNFYLKCIPFRRKIQCELSWWVALN